MSFISWIRFLLKVVGVSILFFAMYYIVLNALLEVINTTFIHPLIEDKDLLVVTRTELMIFLSKSYVTIGLVGFIIIFSVMLRSQVKR